MDVTIRDGSYAINYQWSLGQVAQIAGALDKAGIHYIEVSHGCGLGAAETMGLPAAASDAEYVRSAKSVVKKAKIGVIAGTVTRLKDIDLVIDDIDFIRFATNVNGPRTVEENLNYTKKKRPKLPIFFQLMRSSRLPKPEILNSARIAQEMGAGVVYVVDTAGHFIPQEVEDIVSTLAAKLKIKIGFHGHDNLRMAVANSLAAIRAGAAHVDASLRGMGRAGGNAQIEALVSLMKRTGHARNIDLDALTEAAEEFVAPVMPPTAGISQIDLLTADANINLYPVEFYETIADAAGIDFKRFMRELAIDARTVEADHEAIERSLRKFKVDPDKIFAALGVGGSAEKKNQIRKAMPEVVIALKTNLAPMALPEEMLKGLQSQFPGVKFHLTGFDPQRIEHIGKADVLFAYTMTPEILKSAPTLKWFHAAVIGFDIYAFPELIKSKIKITSPRGVYAMPMAETTVGLMLAFARKIKSCLEFQRKGRWAVADIINIPPMPSELFGSTLVIAGMGDVGEAIARLCAGFGINVIGVVQGKKERSNFVDELVPFERFSKVLPEADFLVLDCPLTERTRGMMGSRELGLMKKEAVLINMARGALVDEAALIEALEKGKIAGAACDAFVTEPLPDGHPFFSTPNMIVLPHISGISTRFWERAMARFAQNLALYIEGKPLIGEVDLKRGY